MNNNNNEINFFTIVKILSNNKKYIVFSIATPLFLAAIYIYIATPQYRSYISINPVNDQSTSASGLQGIASTFGMDIGDNNNSSFYIPDIVNSRILKEAIIYNKWNTQAGSDSLNLISYWEIDKDSGFSFRSLFVNNKYIIKDVKYLEAALEKLTEQISVTEEESGLIIISVLMEEPQLAADISNFIARYIKDYISEIMLLHSSKHRKFIEERLENSKLELSLSEEQLTQFRKKHPFAMDTPDLQLQRGRLIRNVEVNQQVYITLRQQYEMARIDELKETPVINILDKGQISMKKEKPRLGLIILSSLILGFSLTFFSIFSMMIYKEYKLRVIE